MEKIIHLFCTSCIHGLCLRQFFLRSIPDRRDRAETAHQSLSSALSDSRNIIQDRVNLFFTPQRTMILDRKAVCFILDPGDQPESLTVCVDRDLYIIIIKSSVRWWSSLTIPQTGTSIPRFSRTPSAILTWVLGLHPSEAGPAFSQNCQTLHYSRV